MVRLRLYTLFLFVFLFIACASGRKNIIIASDEQGYYKMYYYFFTASESLALTNEELFQQANEILVYKDSIPSQNMQLSLLNEFLDDSILEVRSALLEAFDNVLSYTKSGWAFNESALLQTVYRVTTNSENFENAVLTYERMYELYNTWVDGLDNVGHLGRHSMRNVEIGDTAEHFLAMKIYSLFLSILPNV